MSSIPAKSTRMTRKQRRLALIGGALAVLGIAAGLVLFALNDTIVFFHGPSEVVEKGIKPGTRFRIGGLVKEGSLKRGPDQMVQFEVTDTVKSVPVRYRGLLPDLFREGQGVVAEGALQPTGEFTADSVLAKHDENYMPREVADALKKQGVWNEGSGQGSGKDAAATGMKSP
jgi:cytochrome c-type biogenesis protein CcmE